MNARTLLLGVAVVVAVVAAWFFLRSGDVTNYPSQGTDIIAFGDSLVEGVGGSGGGFVSVLEQEIGQPIINLGRAGDTSGDGLARLNELNEYDPKVVIVLLGGNDYLRRLPQEQTFRNLEAIIENIHERGSMVLLLGIQGGILRDNFEAEFERLAQRHKVAYVPNILRGLLGREEYMYDQVHPNDAGYAQIAERVLPILERLLQE